MKPSSNLREPNQCHHRLDPEEPKKWGTRYDYRLAILAAKNTKAALLKALKKKRFYSTLDKNLSLSFQMADKEMGSSIEEGWHGVVITARDDFNDEFSDVTLMKNGAPFRHWSVSGNSVVVERTIMVARGDYFYVIVKQVDGDEAISSPIFVK